MKQETRCSARTTVNKEKYKSAVTIDWSDVTEDEVQALAQRSIIIRKQNGDRLAGVIPPAEYTLKAKDYCVGVRHSAPALTPEQALSALSPDQLLALLKSKGLA